MHLSVASLVASLSFVTWLVPNASGQNINYNATRPELPPNVTGVVRIPGYRLDQKYPGQRIEASETGWSMHMNITEAARWYDEDVEWTGFDFELRAPTEPPAALYDAEGNFTVEDEVAETWRMSIVSLGFQDEVVVDQNRPDGSCEDFLSEQCTDDLTKIMLGPRGTPGPTYSLSISVIHRASSESCPWGDYAQLKVFPFDENFKGNATWSMSVPKAPASGDYENAYDHLGYRTVPFAILFGNNNASATGEGTSSDHIVFACIKATDAVGDSRLPSSGTWGTRPSSNAWVVGSVCLLTYLIMS